MKNGKLGILDYLTALEKRSEVTERRENLEDPGNPIILMKVKLQVLRQWLEEVLNDNLEPQENFNVTDKLNNFRKEQGGI